jgi:hypothetical protein
LAALGKAKGKGENGTVGAFNDIILDIIIISKVGPEKA